MLIADVHTGNGDICTLWRTVGAIPTRCKFFHVYRIRFLLCLDLLLPGADEEKINFDMKYQFLLQFVLQFCWYGFLPFICSCLFHFSVILFCSFSHTLLYFLVGFLHIFVLSCGVWMTRKHFTIFFLIFVSIKSPTYYKEY